MGKFTFVSQCQRNENRRNGRVDCDLAISVNKSGSDKLGKSRRAIVFRISNSLAKQARFIEGDIIDIGIDLSDRTGLLRRTNSDRGNKLGTRKNKYFRVSVTMYPDIFPYDQDKLFSVTEAEVVSVDDEGILFIFPVSDKDET